MPFFISHSHQDNVFVEKCARQLVRRGVNVWVDTWELKVGDSLLSKVQGAIDGAFALGIVISKASMQSEWCRKELDAGLLKELEQKHVFVLPILLEKIEQKDLPIFVRGKLYANFSKSFDEGIAQLARSLAQFDNLDQSRFISDHYYTDWSVEYGQRVLDNVASAFIIFSAIQQHIESKFSVYIEMAITLDESLSQRFEEHRKAGTEDLFGRELLLQLAKSMDSEDRVQVTLNSPSRKFITMSFPIGIHEIELKANCRWLGTKTGMDVVVDLPGLLNNIFSGFDEYLSKFIPPLGVKKFKEIEQKWNE